MKTVGWFIIYVFLLLSLVPMLALGLHGGGMI